MRRRICVAWSLGLLSMAPIASPAQTQRPALVVLIAVDQLRGDYLDRWSSQLTGGLARFRNTGAFFPHAWQDHSNTETAPGHATMLSGREPVHTEIVSNGRGVPDPTAPLLGSPGPGASPRRFVGTTLYDWMLARDSGVRVLSISRKDRGAILPVGRAKGDVYWFSGGVFTTSRYYRDALPAWLTKFDAQLDLSALAGTKWGLLLPASSYSEPDSVGVENGGSDIAFPHRLPDADMIASQLEKYPWMDSVTLAAAWEGVQAMHLGRRGLAAGGTVMPDLLCVSLSTTDAVGHAFGPDSREIHDQVLRVDRWLGAFMQRLEAEIPSQRILYVLTADHGVAPLPELDVQRTGVGGRVSFNDVANALETSLAERFDTEFGITFDNGLIYADVAALRARRIDVDSLSRALASQAMSRRGVRAAYTRQSLAESSDSAAVRWRRTLPPSLGWLVALDPAPGFVWSDGKLTAEHGTPNELSRSVPISFLGAGVVTRRNERLVRTVDIAPTLAHIIGIEPLEPLDGQTLPEVLRPTP